MMERAERAEKLKHKPYNALLWVFRHRDEPVFIPATHPSKKIFNELEGQGLIVRHPHGFYRITTVGRMMLKRGARDER